MSGKRAKRMRAAAGAVMTGEQSVQAPGTAKELRRAARVLAEELAPGWAQARVNPQPVVVDAETRQPIPREELVRLLKQQERSRSRWPVARH
jgi:riboflavin biosynthesis pyrimidine reductase